MWIVVDEIDASILNQWILNDEDKIRIDEENEAIKIISILTIERESVSER